jgi:hypothetical protein
MNFVLHAPKPYMGETKMTKLEDQKLFSLNDLIAMELITRKQLEDHLRYMEAKKMVKELFPGMF